MAKDVKSEKDTNGDLNNSSAVKQETPEPKALKREEITPEQLTLDIDIKPKIVPKTSMQILSELFGTFDAEPPVIVKKEKVEKDAKEKKHKKHKKHKSKSKKRKKDKKSKRESDSSDSSDSDSSSSDDKLDLANILIKQENERSKTKLKIEGTSLLFDLKDIKVDVDKIRKRKTEIKEEGEIRSDSEAKTKKSKKAESPKQREKKLKSRSHSKESSTSRLKDKEKSKYKEELDSYREDVDKLKSKSSRIEKQVHSRDRERHRDHKSNRSRGRSSERERFGTYYEPHKDSNRERDPYRDRESYRDREHRDSHRPPRRDERSDFYRGSGSWKERDRSPQRRDSYRDRERDDRSKGLDRDFWKDNRSENDRRRRSADRFRQSPDNRVIDKKKLLAIARKNAIQMMKSGELPEALTLGRVAQEKVIAAIKSGGKSVEELTDFCKTLSKKEAAGVLSDNEDQPSDTSDTEVAFHHPFQIKDRPTSITMNIKNSVPLPIKSTQERTSELRLQFPVSSGTHHRGAEHEWVPVEPLKTVTADSKTAEKAAATALAVANIPKPAAAAPAVEATCIPAICPPPEIPSELVALTAPEAMSSALVPLPSAPGPQVFPPKEPKVDISSVVSERLTAIRKLQENPNDVQALSEMYKSNKKMESWAKSKQIPGSLGAFGSSNCNMLSQAELSSGYQAWAKKNQLQTAAPLSGGMGMHLLQKMGWKPGEGLGKEKSGALEPLLLEVKLDKKGLVANEEQKGKRGKKGQTNVVKQITQQQGKHPVSLLGEYASKKKLGAPQYTLCFECGPDHKKHFLFQVNINGKDYKPTTACANKKEAKANAAMLCLQQLGLL